MTAWGAAAPIRVRLTAWYTTVLTLMLVVYAAATFVAVRHEFLEQLDDELHADFEEAEGLLTPAAKGRVSWPGDRHYDADSEADRGSDVWSAAGEQIYQSPASAVLPPVAATAVTSAPRYASIVAAGHRWRTLVGTTSVGGHAVVLRVSRSEDRLQRQLWEVLVVLALGLPMVVALAGFGGYILARRALTPIDHLASEARRITADRLHERLSVPNQTDEIGRLASVINDTFARLEGSFDELRRFTADASHELRTPLSVIRGIGEIADEGPGIAAEHRARIFDRFFRVDEARSRDRGGTGLGLAIAKWAVEIHGGRISVDNGPNGGSTFRIRLPVDLESP